MVFGPKLKIFDFGKKMISFERATEKERNGANFSSIASASEDLNVPILVSHSNIHAW